jgi:predicted MFS family arabinose efflux permease
MTTHQTADRKWILPFAATVFAMMTMQMSSLGFSPLLPDIQKELGLSFSQVGLFTGVYGLVALVMSIPAGILAKRFGEKMMLGLGLLGIAIGILLLSQATSFFTGLASRIAWLVGYRTAFVCVMTAVALTAPSGFRGLAMGILGAMSSLATVIGAPFGTTIRETYGWRGGMMAFAGMALLGAIVLWLFYSKHEEAAAPLENRALEASQLKSVFRNPLAWAMILLGLANMGGFATTFFVPFAAEKTFGLGRRDAALMISTAYTVAIFANLLCGYLADKLNRWVVMASLMILLVPASLAMLSTDLLVFRIAASLVISLGLCATNQIFAIAREVFGGKETGNVMGIVAMGGGVFGYLGPQMLGYLRQRTGGYEAGWYLNACAALISLAVILFLKSRTSPTRNQPAAVSPSFSRP